MEHSAIQRVHSQLSDIAQPSDQLATWISDDLELLEVYEGLQIRTVLWEKNKIIANIIQNILNSR